MHSLHRPHHTKRRLFFPYISTHSLVVFITWSVFSTSSFIRRTFYTVILDHWRSYPSINRSGKLKIEWESSLDSLRIFHIFVYPLYILYYRHPRSLKIISLIDPSFWWIKNRVRVVTKFSSCFPRLRLSIVYFILSSSSSSSLKIIAFDRSIVPVNN